MKKISLLLVLFVAVFACSKQDPLPTQGNITGKVLDADEGTPVTGVTVSLSGNSGSYTTSSDGGYAFNDIVAGSYTITGVKTGYVSGSKTVTVVPEKTVNGDFTMKKDLPNSSVSEIVFNPQNITEEQSFTLINTREGNMSFSIQASKTWIKVSPSSGSIPSQNQFVINISIDYEAIPYNTYSEFIIINAGQASLQIPVKVTYAAPQFTINIGATEGGEVDNLGGVLEQGEEVTVTATAFNGYEFFKWSNGSTANPYSFTVTQSFNLTAEFRKKSFQITTNVEGEGSIEQTLLTPGTSTSYEFESTVKLEAVPANGWEFKEWKGSYAGSNNPIEVEVNQDKEYTAVFIRKQLDLIIEIEGEGTVSQEIVTSPTKYEYQTIVKLTAVPDNEWIFTGWEGDLSGNTNPKTIEINSAKTVKAIFKKPTYSLSVTTIGEGAVSKQIVTTSSVTEYEGATSVRLTATPSNNWTFKSWSGDINSTSNPVVINVNANKAVTATFEEKDSDNDGVPDSADSCPNTPLGASVDSNGCASSQKDSDGDGVKDNLDQCPNTPSGETVNSNGCSSSERDSDGDGVIDSLDNCANTPSGATVDDNGCPYYFDINNSSIPDNVAPGGQVRVSWSTNYSNKTLRVELSQYQSNTSTVLRSNLSIGANEYIWLVSPTIAPGFYQINIYDQSTNQELGSTKLIQVQASCEEIPMQDSVFEKWLFDNGYDNLLDNKVDSCKIAEITEIIDPTMSTRIDWSIFKNLEKIHIYYRYNTDEADIDLSNNNSLIEVVLTGYGNDNTFTYLPSTIKRLTIIGDIGFLKTNVTASNFPSLEFLKVRDGLWWTFYNSISSQYPSLKEIFILEDFGLYEDVDLGYFRNLTSFSTEGEGVTLYSDKTLILCGLTSLQTVILPEWIRTQSGYHEIIIQIEEELYDVINWRLPTDADRYRFDYGSCQ